MFCENCGGSINPGDISCPNCGISLSTAKIKSGNSGPVKTTGLLIFCIITLLFCFPFGLIGLIMYFTSLQDAIRTGDLPKIEKKKKNISNLLIVGIILGAILPLLLIFLIAIPNFSGIQNRMQIRADKSTAAQIGKATRIWYSEILMDPELQAIANEEEVENNFVRLDKIELLEKATDSIKGAKLTKKAERPSLYSALDIGVFWLEDILEMEKEFLSKLG